MSLHKLARISTLFILSGLLLLTAGTGHTGDEVIKNMIDKRDYRVLTLPNGLRALLVSDPETDKAAAALNVNIGYFSDPPDRPGMAHFLEHMLFLGTETYPEPDAYREFITRHGGRVNAFVSAENTVYFLDIDHNHLGDALDRFSRFFTEPLFDEDYVQREINAIDSEYRMGLREDSRRLLDVVKETINPEHPFAKFSVGSLDTLTDRDDDPIRDAVIAFYEEHYSADIMTLAIVGAEPMAKLEKLVREHFSTIRQTDARAVKVDVPVRKPSQGPVRINAIPQRDTRDLRFEFIFPWDDDYHLSKPQMVIGQLLGHEGDGSLHQLLKDKGWINSLSAGGRRFASNEGVFVVAMNLTPEGIDHVDDIGEYLFQYIALNGAEGNKARIHAELRRINQLDFEFRESANPAGEVISLSGNLHDYPDDKVLFGPYHLGEYDDDEIRALYARLRPDNLRLTVIAPDLPTERTSHWYQTDYSIAPLDEALLKRWTDPEPDEALAAPGPNPFLPDDTRVRKIEGAPPLIPARLINEDGLELWHLQDNEFEVPRANLRITVETLPAVESVRNHVKTALFLSLIRDRLNAEAYPARLAGLGYNLSTDLRGFNISVSGYNDKQSLLLDLILDNLLDPAIDPDRFEIRRTEMIRQWDNIRHDRPFTQLQGGLQSLLHGAHWPVDERVDALRDVTLKELKAFIPVLLAQTRIEILAHGNITADDAVAVARNLADRLFEEGKRGKRIMRKVAQLPPGHQYLYDHDIDHDDTALIVYYQGNEDVDGAAHVMMLEQIVRSPFFDALRTRDQLGYVVGATRGLSLRVPSLNLIIQSPVAGPATLLARIDLFLEEYRERLEAMDDDTFEGHRQGLLTSLLERDTHLGSRSQRLQHNLSLRHYDFDRREQVAAAVTMIGKDDLLAFHDDWLLSDNRRRIVVQSPGNPHRDDAIEADKHGFERIDSPGEFKRKMSGYEL